MRDDLNDPLEDIFNAAGQPATVVKPVPPESYTPPTYTETCKKCGGRGSIYSYSSGRTIGQCFACKGAGKRTFKTSRQERVNAQASREAREDRARVEAYEAFKAANPEVFAWLVAKAGTFDFALSMLNALNRFKSLTDNQLAACQRLVAKDKARDAERTARVEAAPAVEVGALEAAFEKARNYKRLPNQHGVKRLTLRLDTFIFKPAANHPGTIYVTDKTETDSEYQPLYLGKIVGGRFQASRACGEARAARVVAAASDPAKAAQAYGQRFGACCVCGRELTAEGSIVRNMGPICAERFGF